MEDEKEPEIFPMKIDARDIALTIEVGACFSLLS